MDGVDSGRGWVRDLPLEMAWGLVGRRRVSVGQHRAPALRELRCAGWREDRSRGLSRPAWRRDCGVPALASQVGRASTVRHVDHGLLRNWVSFKASLPGRCKVRRTSELDVRRPEDVDRGRREGLGGHDLPDPGRCGLSSRLCAITWTAGAVGGEAPRRHQPDAVLDGARPRRGGDDPSSSSVSPSRSVT